MGERSYAERMSRPGAGSLVEGSDGDYIWHPAAIQIALDADAEIAALRERVAELEAALTFVADHSTEPSIVDRVDRALLGEGGEG
jgi:hypothetical protein